MKILRSGFDILCLLALAACGGGGGGAGSTQSSPPPSPAAQGAPVVQVSVPGAVFGYSTVALDASASTDAKSSLTNFTWSQTAGPAVTLTNASTATASFVAPQVTSNTSLTFKVTITDALGTSADANASVIVKPASAASIAASLVVAEFHAPVVGNPHNDSVPIDTSPQAGASLILHVVLGGSIATANFSLIDQTGTKISDVQLAQVSNGGLHPIDYYGSVTVPSMPFFIQAIGTTGDGAPYAVSSLQKNGASALIVPIGMALSLDHTQAQMSRGSSLNVNLTITNPGADNTFSVAASDPKGVMTVTPALQVGTVARNSSRSFPITVTFPATGSAVFAKVNLTAIGDSSNPMQATTTFTAILDGAP